MWKRAGPITQIQLTASRHRKMRVMCVHRSRGIKRPRSRGDIKKKRRRWWEINKEV